MYDRSLCSFGNILSGLPLHRALCDQCWGVCGGVLWGVVGGFGVVGGCIVVWMFLVMFLSGFVSCSISGVLLVFG